MNNHAVTLDKIQSFESQWNVDFPKEYEEFLLAGKQEDFRGKCFDFLVGGEADSSVLQDFFVLSGEAYRRIDFYMKDRLGRFMLDCIPIASDVFGNLILLKSGGDGVYFWEHEREGQEGALNLLAKGFDHFLLSLRDLREDGE